MFYDAERLSAVPGLNSPGYAGNGPFGRADTIAQMTERRNSVCAAAAEKIDRRVPVFRPAVYRDVGFHDYDDAADAVRAETMKERTDLPYPGEGDRLTHGRFYKAGIVDHAGIASVKFGDVMFPQPLQLLLHLNALLSPRTSTFLLRYQSTRRGQSQYIFFINELTECREYILFTLAILKPVCRPGKNRMNAWDKYNAIRAEIDRIALHANRDPERISIIAVTKTFPEDVIQDAIDRGMRVFGENKVQEARRKIPNLKGEFRFHMIGHLQSNKARDAVSLFDIIHSIDKIGTAEKVSEEAGKRGKRQKILIQVNISGEETKSGTEADECRQLAERIVALPNMELLGLMTMAPLTDDINVVRSVFRGARLLLGDLNESLNLNLQELSMGMSSDYRIAVEEGATMVRIGSAIFGERDYR